MDFQNTQVGQEVTFTQDDLNRSTPFQDVQVGETVQFDDNQLGRSETVQTPQETQSYYIEEQDRVVDAPIGMQEDEIKFLDQVQNDEEADTSQFFGFNRLFQKTADVVALPFKGAAATTVNLGATGEAGARLKIADAIKQGFEENTDAIRRKSLRGEKLTDEESRIMLREINDFNNPLAWLTRSPEDIIRGKVKKAVKKNDVEAIEKFRKKEERLRASVGKIRKNADEIIVKHFARPEKEDSVLAERVLYDFGGVTTTIGASIGLAVVTKNPIASATLFSELQNSSIYLEARDKGVGIEKARAKAQLAGNVEGALEFVGVSYFFRIAETSTGLRKHMLRMGEEALQEFLQSGAESAITQSSGIREVDVMGALQEAGYSAFLGSLGGGTTSVTMDVLAKRVEEQTEGAVPAELAKKFLEKVEESSDVMEGIVASEIEKEASGIKSEADAAATEKALSYLDQFAKGQPIDISQLDRSTFEALQELRDANIDQRTEEIEAQEQSNFLAVPRRPKTLSQFLKEKGGLKLDTLEAQRFTRKESPALGGLANRNGTLSLDEARELAVEAGYLRDEGGDGVSESDIQQLLDALEAEAFGADIVSEADIGALENRNAILEFNEQRDQANAELLENAREVKSFRTAFREGVRAAKKDVKAAQDAAIKILEENLPDSADRAEFIRALKNIDSAEKLRKAAPDFERRIERIMTDKLRNKQKTRVKNMLSNKSLKRKPQAGKRVGKYDAATQERLEYLQKLYQTPGKKVNKNAVNKKLYHGTREDFESFSLDFYAKTDEGFAGKGIYFTNDKSIASEYAEGGGRVVERYVRMDNPLIVDNYDAISKQAGVKPGRGGKTKAERIANSEKMTQALIRQGYDGVVIKDTSSSGKPVDEYLVFSPEQITTNKQEAPGDNPAAEMLQTFLDADVPDPLANAILQMKASPRDVSPFFVSRVADSIQAIKKFGLEEAERRMDTRRYEAKTIREVIENQIDPNADLLAQKRKGGVRKTVREGIAWGVEAWEDYIDRIMPADQAEALEVGREVSKQKGIQRVMNEKIIKAAQDAFGKDRKALNTLLDESHVPIDLGVFENMRGELERVEISKAQARKLWMEYQSEEIRTKTLQNEAGNAYTDQMLRTIFDILTPEDIQFAQAQLDIYEEFYDQINEVYSKVFGINLPKNDFYSPIAREADLTETNTDPFGREVNFRQQLASGSALKLRDKKAVAALARRSDLEVYNRHVAEMSHFIAFREKTMLLNDVFGDAKLRRKIDAKFGEQYLKNVDQIRERIAGGGVQAANIADKIVNYFNRNFSTSVLGGKAKIGITQMSSYFSYAEFLKGGSIEAHVALVDGTRDFIKNYKKAVKILGESELMRDRGYSEEVEIQRMGQTFDSKFLRKVQKKKENLIDYSLIFTKLGDRGAIYLGGWSVYKQAIDQGKTHEQAIAAFERATAKTQQSKDVDQVSLMQSEKSIGRTLAMFQSAPFAQFRGEVRAFRQYFFKKEITGKEFGKRFLVYHILIPQFYRALSNGLLFGEFDGEDQLWTLMLGSLNAIPLFSDLVNFGLREIQGKPTREGGLLKWSGTMYEVVNDGLDALINAGDGDFELAAEYLGDVGLGVGSLVGLPVPQSQQIMEGIEDVQYGDTKQGVMKIFGFPDGVAEGDD